MSNIIDRNKFEIFVEQNATSVEDFLEMVKQGKIEKNQWVFTLDQVVKICDRAAMGIFYNARKLPNPKGKWATEAIRKQVTKIITDAFSS